MDEPMWRALVAELGEAGLEFDAGLTDLEVASAETRFGFRFPPDLKAFLQAGLPRGEGFPDWRSGSESTLREWFDFPRRGILSDVLEFGYWLNEWGVRPDSDDETARVVTELVEAAPRLIPIIYSDWCSRMMPAEPHLCGNPVFAVRYTDIIWWGVDLRDFLIHEFLASKDVNIWPIPTDIRRIAFWDVERFQEGRCRRTRRST